MEKLKSETQKGKEQSANNGGFSFALNIDGHHIHKGPLDESIAGKYEMTSSGVYSRKKGYEQTAAALKEHFEYKPLFLSRALIKFISRITLPIEEGSYNGKRLPGQPHRLKWVSRTPLTVFVVHGKKKKRSLLLASRLGNKIGINIIDLEKKYVGKANGKNVQVAPTKGNNHQKGKVFGSRSLFAKAFGKRDKHSAITLAGIKREQESVKKQTFKEKNRGKDGRNGRAGTKYTNTKIPALLITGREPDPLETLLKIQSESAFPIRIIPVIQASQHSIIEECTSSLTGVASLLFPSGVIKRLLATFYNLRTGKIACCHPIYVDEYLPHPVYNASSENIDFSGAARKLKSSILNRMIAQHRALSGPPHPGKKNVKQMVLSDPQLVSYMYEYSIQNGVTLEGVRKEAEDCLKEIASDYSPLVARMFCAVVDYLFNRFLEGIEVDPSGISLISSADTKSRIVLVCSHKSYIDPLLIGYALYRSGLMPPQQVAGENLSFFPVGWLLRHCGAFYIRRNFIGETLYREVFEAYVRYLLAKNHIITLYIEGTRSRDGKVSHPKLGFMKILKEALDVNVCKDILLIPVYLGYDRVPEESSHVREMCGGKKVAESVGGFAALYKAVNTTLGRAFVRFGKPLSMRRSLSSSSLEGVAKELCCLINSLTPLTGRICASASLLALANPEADFERIFEGASFLLDLGKAKGIELVDDRASIKKALNWLVTEGYVNLEDRNGIGVYVTNENGRRFLFYNANIGIGHFIDDCLIAVARAVLLSEENQGQACVNIKKEAKTRMEKSGYLKFLVPDSPAYVFRVGSLGLSEREFFSDEDNSALKRLILSADEDGLEPMKALISFLKEIFDREFFFKDNTLETKDFGLENDLSGTLPNTGGFSKRAALQENRSASLMRFYEFTDEPINQAPPAERNRACGEREHSGEAKNEVKQSWQIYLLASFLVPFIEAYAISARTLSQLQPGNWYSEDDFLDLCYSHGNESLKAGIIRRPESLSKTALLTSAEKFAESDLIRIRYQKEEDSKRKFAFYKCLDFDELRTIENMLLEIASAIWRLNHPTK